MSEKLMEHTLLIKISEALSQSSSSNKRRMSKAKQQGSSPYSPFVQLHAHQERTVDEQFVLDIVRVGLRRLSQVNSRYERIRGRKAHLLEDKQIPSSMETASQASSDGVMDLTTESGRSRLKPALEDSTWRRRHD
ncbi:hypothetical protein Tco_0792167 [Tanacetum coccineum]